MNEVFRRQALLLFDCLKKWAPMLINGFKQFSDEMTHMHNEMVIYAHANTQRYKHTFIVNCIFTNVSV